jgi:putative ABC transport system permease protein
VLFTQIILKNLRHRATRTLLTVLGLAIAVAAITVLWNTAWGYADSAGNYYAARDVDIVVVRAGVSNRLTSRLGIDLKQRLAAVPNVAHVDGILTEMVLLGDSNLLGIPFRGYALDSPTLAKLQLRDGRPLAASDSSTVLIGNALAAALNMKAGETLEIEGTPFTISGVFLGNNPFDANSIVGRLPEVQKLMGRADVVSEYQLSVAPAARDEAGLDQVCRAIESLRDDAGAPLGFKAQPTNLFIHRATEARLGTAMAWATTAIVTALSLLGMLNTMLMSVAERTRELGILQAIGWRKSRILRLVLGESLLISVAAAVAGSIVAVLLVQALALWPRTSLLVPSHLSTVALAVGSIGAIVMGIAGSLYPAAYAANLPPVEALERD